MRIYISIATACNGITFTTKYNTLSTDHDKGEFIPDCCIASCEAPPAYHTYALVIVTPSIGSPIKDALLQFTEPFLFLVFVCRQDLERSN